MITKRILSLLLLAVQAAACISCGQGKPVDTVGLTSSAETTAQPEDPYDFSELDCGGDEFTILNTSPVWDMYTYLNFENMTGEIIDDAVYDRNRFLEDKYNYIMDIIEVPLDDLRGKIELAVNSQDDIYDVAYCRGGQINSIITNGYVMNLFDIPELQLSEEWWNQSLIESASLGGNALYIAHNYFSLTSFDNVWSIFFNRPVL